MEKEEKKQDVNLQENKKVDSKAKVETEKKEKTNEPKFTKVKPEDLKKEEKMQKHESKQNKKEKESKNKSKAGYWIGGVIIVILLLAIVAALILLPKSPQKAVEGMLNCLKNGDFENINKYVNYDEILQNVSTSEDKTLSQDIQILLFDKLSWRVLNTTQNADTTTVEVEITNKNFKTILSNYIQEVLKVAFSGEVFTEEEQNNKLLDQLKREDVDTVATTVTLQVNKQDEDWKVVVNEELINALLPGFQETMSTINV